MACMKASKKSFGEIPSAPLRINSARRLKRFQAVAASRQAGLALVLEDIHDPHNAAAILRTCDGLGIQDVYFIFSAGGGSASGREKEKPYNPKKVGKVSSSSANKWLTYHIYRSTKECFRDLKKKKYKIYATVLDPKAKNLLTTGLHMKNLALVVGNEHRGISETAKELADQLLYFPMQGFVESFNVSISAALFLYEIIRQRNSTNRLSKKETLKLLVDFKKR